MDNEYTNDVRTYSKADSLLYGRFHDCLVATLRNQRAFQVKLAVVVTSQLLDSIEGDLQAEMTTDCVKSALQELSAPTDMVEI